MPPTTESTIRGRIATAPMKRALAKKSWARKRVSCLRSMSSSFADRSGCARRCAGMTRPKISTFTGISSSSIGPSQLRKTPLTTPMVRNSGRLTSLRTPKIVFSTGTHGACRSPVRAPSWRAKTPQSDVPMMKLSATAGSPRTPSSSSRCGTTNTKPVATTRASPVLTA